MKSTKKVGGKGRPSELSNNRAPGKPSGDDGNAKVKFSKEFKYIIRLLDDTQKPLELTLTREDVGQRLFSMVCNAIGDLVEYDYFGLRYTDKFGEEQWIDLSKSVHKQLKSCKSNELFFRLKHYPLDPISDLKQHFTRYLVYLQLRRDLTHGRLLCPSTMAPTVGSLIAQAELGDAPPEKVNELSNNCQTTEADGGEQSPDEKPDTHGDRENYIKHMNIFPSQTPEMEVEIMKKHQQLRGLTAQEAESELLNRVSKFQTYGVHPFLVVPHHKVIVPLSPTPSSDESSVHNKLRRSRSSPTPDSTELQPFPKGTNFYLDVTGNGLVFYAGLKRIQDYLWSDINRLRCDGKQFIVNLKRGESKSRQLTFDCTSQSAALALWRWTIDRKCFFTLKEAKEAKRLRPTSNIFHRSQSYRFSGRSYQELSTIPITSSKDDFIRIASLRYATRPNSAFTGHLTLPDRLRPKLDLAEELSSNENTVETVPLEESVEASKPVYIPDLVIEKPISEESPTVTEPDVVEQWKADAVCEEEEIFVEEAPIEAKEVPQQLFKPAQITPAVEDETSDEQAAQEIRNRVDSNLIHNVVYEQVMSALDLAIDDHMVGFAGSTDHTTDTVPNGKIHLNGSVVVNQNGPLYKKHNHSLAKSNVEASKFVTVPDDLHRDSPGGSGKKASVTVTVAVVVVLLGLVTMLETTPDTNSIVVRFMRSNALISGFEYYVYSPVRDAILSGLAFIWS